MTITLTNCEGKKIRVPKKATIAELFRRGVTSVGFHKPGDVLPPNWYSSCPTKPSA